MRREGGRFHRLVVQNDITMNNDKKIELQLTVSTKMIDITAPEWRNAWSIISYFNLSSASNRLAAAVGDSWRGGAMGAMGAMGEGVGWEDFEETMIPVFS